MGQELSWTGPHTAMVTGHHDLHPRYANQIESEQIHIVTGKLKYFVHSEDSFQKGCWY